MDEKLSVDDLDALRGYIQTIDIKILSLLKERVELTDAIGEIKKDAKLPVCVQEVEDEKLKLLTALGKPELNPSDVGVVFTSIIRSARTRQFMMRDVSPTNS